MNKRININYENLKSYVQMSNTPIDAIRGKVKKIDEILVGETNPTFKQLSDIAKIINIPTGLLLLNKKININDNNINFRTINSHTLSEMSPELRDTIAEMQTKQDFLKSEVETDLDFVGLFSIRNKESEVKESEVLEQLISLLGDNCTSDRLSKYRKRLNSLGVFVFINGKVKDNTHRNLNLNEFRGFVLTDKKAPIIFINQKDTKTGQLFTLIHEFVHLLLGENELSESNHFNSTDRIEVFVNKIAGAFLVPKSSIESIFDSSVDLAEQLEKISRKFEVSKFVITRRLLDLKYINQNEYDSIIQMLNVEFENNQKYKKKPGGGNYLKNLNYRMDKSFFKYLNNARIENRISYSEAINIAGVGYKGYKHLMEEVK